MVKLNLIYYGIHNNEVEQQILNVCPEFLISNTMHGLWGAIFGEDTNWLLHDVTAYNEAQIKVIGYITGGYEGRRSTGGIDPFWYSLEKNMGYITNMAVIDQVDGIFIDECTAMPDGPSKNYLQALTEHAHSHGLITWGNVGVDSFDPWYLTDGGFDFIHSTEAWCDKDLTSVQSIYGKRLSVAGLMTSTTTLEEAVHLTIRALQKGIAYCYITPAYTMLPEWLVNYALEIRKYERTDHRNP